MSNNDPNTKRFRLSVDIEIIETDKYSGVIHTHRRAMQVSEFSDLEAASDAFKHQRALAEGERS